MKTQKKAIIAKKATKPSVVVKKRRILTEQSEMETKKEKKLKKVEKFEDLKKKLETEKKKVEKKSPEEKKKIEERRKDKVERADEKNDKKKLIKDWEKKTDKVIEKKAEEKNEEEVLESNDKKKSQKSESKIQAEKSISDVKRKPEKVEEKNKIKTNEETLEKISENDEKDPIDNKAIFPPVVTKKKNEKKKELKLLKPDSKENCKSIKEFIKEKKLERKKFNEEDSSKKLSPIKKKDLKVKQMKKIEAKKTVLTKKSNPSAAKRFVEKKLKLVKCLEGDEESITEFSNELEKKIKKKPVSSKIKTPQEKKANLEKQIKAKLPHKKLILRREEKAKNLEKAKKKFESKDSEKAPEFKKSGTNEIALDIQTSDIKTEVEDKEPEKIKDDLKKVTKNSKAKVPKKSTKKASKVSKDQDEDTEKEGFEKDESKPESTKNTGSSKQEHAESLIKINLKVEASNAETSGSSSTSESTDDESWTNGRRRSAKRKERTRTPSDERARRMRLFGFWSGPKRHRVASLNALAKVHCLYENEAGGVYLGGFCKPKPEKEKQKKAKEEKDKEKEKEKEKIIKKEKEKKEISKNEEILPKRKLRKVPGLRGKHWDNVESMSSSSSSSEEDCENEKNEKVKKVITKRRKKNEEVMDLKDMVVCKRMASLNASAMLAASYSDEKIRLGSDSDSSSESEVEIIKRKRQSDSEDKLKRQVSEPEEVIKPSKKVVIVNQDTDVTITGVYVNQTRSTHHEGFCSIAGMQYRISSTSHTQTAATAVATELHDQQKPEQPCKSYTPLGALSSMQPPGTQGNRPNMSPRRHSAFSAPHQHGYYQPAGPLIQHPPTLPPVKGPPPEPTPTPPQNSEGSDDLVATSASSGTSGGASFYRAYCPQYYSTPPQYQELCYPPTYAHPHPHPPPYYKYPPTYRRQYYGYQESGGGGPGGGGAGAGPGVVEYQPPPPPGEYPLPPYYAGYPPPPPPPPPNPAYLHPQGRPFVDHAAFQSCPCPMQSCPKNVDTGPLIGNGKGAPVASGPGLSLPPSALVGPPSPARGLAGLAPPHGANAWDTDRVQLNPLRNLNQNQPSLPTSHNHVGSHNRPQNSECRTKDEKNCTKSKTRECSCQKHACTSTCEVKIESIPPSEKLSTMNSPDGKIHSLKLENNNVKCESCSIEIGENLSCAANCNVKCESGYKCEILKCEQCIKEGQMAVIDMDKDSGILLIDDKLENDTEVKEELNDVVVINGENWKKPDYEPTVRETVEENEPSEITPSVEEEPKCQKLTKRKLSLDSLSDSRKKRKVNKRTLSVGSTRDSAFSEQSSDTSSQTENLLSDVDGASESCILKKKQTKKETQNPKRKAETSNPSEMSGKKPKISKSTHVNNTVNSLKPAARETSIMETINTVIQQSVEMTEKKDRKTKNLDRVIEKNKKNANLMSTIKKVTRKLELNSVTEKICLPKTETKSNQPKGKAEAKPKPKIQDAKCKSKVKAKLLEVKSKILNPKSKVQEPKNRETCKKIECLPKLRSGEVVEDAKKTILIKKKRKSTKKTLLKRISGKFEENVIVNEHLTVARKPFLKPKWSNGWSWEGNAYEAKVYLTNEESAIRRCYASMRHVSGDILRPRDCVLLKSGPRKADLPFVAKIAALWENPDDGEMMFSLLWYYRPEHTEQGRTEYDTEDEVFASRHRDANSVACIEDKCYILTFNEYCRYRKNIRRLEEGLESPCLIVPPGDQIYPRENRQPPLPVPADMVLFCRRVYDYRGKKLVKNPG